MITAYLHKPSFRSCLTGGGVLLFFLFASSTNLLAQEGGLPVAKLNKLIAEVLAPTGAKGPGVAIYLKREGAVPYRKVSGMANLEYNIPLTENSVFDLASVAKQFTGFAIARLVQTGEIKLTDNVRKYLPEVPDFGEPITLAHLLYHTSGLRDVGTLNGIGNFGGAFTATTALRIVSRQKALNFMPGTEHDYSNTGYVLLAVVVERVTGKRFVSWCQENIFQPLNMKASFANDSPVRLVPDRAVAYYGTESDFTFNQNNGMSLIGSSAVYSSLSDMEKWMAVFSGEDQSLTELMTTPGQLSDGTPVNYNFGLSFSTMGSYKLISHTGSTPAGFRTLTAYLPDEGISLVILSNWGNLNAIQELAQPIISMILDEAAAVGSEEAQEAVIEVSVPEDLLSSYTGTYLFNQEREVGITLEDGKLIIAIAGMQPTTLVPRSSTDFYLALMHSVLSFEVVDGKISRVAITEGEQEVGELRYVEQLKEQEKFVRPDDIAGKYYSEELGQNFTLDIQEEELYLTNASHGTSLLRQISSTTFIVSAGWFEKVELQTTSGGDISGFTISLGSRARNLQFKKLETPYK
jgi:CubicO group peptidase (beta-lactamase class C family)